FPPLATGVCICSMVRSTAAFRAAVIRSLVLLARPRPGLRRNLGACRAYLTCKVMLYIPIDRCQPAPYRRDMIKSFKDKGLERFATRGDHSKLSVQNHDRVARILARLDAAQV